MDLIYCINFEYIIIICKLYAIHVHSVCILIVMQKDQRHEKILELIRSRDIATQESLTSYLELEGVSVNQSSVSRDLDELGIVKVNGFYALPEKTNFTNFGLFSLEIAGDNMIVAKTELGMASAVCVRIDKANLQEIVGTIAGEDAIFIAVRGHKEQKTALKKIWEMFEN